MALTIDTDKCIGCGVCASMLESVFEMNDDAGVAEVKDEKGALVEEIKEAMEACPVEAISI